jgi:subfamily B ATP-binding cassette protein MsbA
MDTEPDVREAPDAHALSERVERIVFENVSFAYDSEHVLRGIDLSVPAGDMVAVVGSSGAGKTTLVSLVPRLFDVTSGRILINDHDVRDLTFASLRRLIGIVTQETILFNDTVANNIAYGQTDASREAIEDAARRANAHDFIMQMPQAYDAMIGERGTRLSGGQSQRIAIARALLRDPPILILDEATSSLDTESERMVQAALDELVTGRTVFAIAHRLSTIVRCDRILVLDGGRIVEQGRHKDLLEAGGVYKRLYDLQFEMNEPDAPAEEEGTGG